MVNIKIHNLNDNDVCDFFFYDLFQSAFASPDKPLCWSRHSLVLRVSIWFYVLLFHPSLRLALGEYQRYF